MRTSTKCPWCENQMKEQKLSDNNIRRNKRFRQYYLDCDVCDAQGPIYIKKKGEMVFLPSKNGVPK